MHPNCTEQVFHIATTLQSTTFLHTAHCAALGHHHRLHHEWTPNAGPGNDHSSLSKLSAHWEGPYRGCSFSRPWIAGTQFTGTPAGQCKESLPLEHGLTVPQKSGLRNQDRTVTVMPSAGYSAREFRQAPLRSCHRPAGRAQLPAARRRSTDRTSARLQSSGSG